MIEINVIDHYADGSRAESIATATIDDDGRVTASSDTVRTQTLLDRYKLLQDVWSRVEEISRAIAAAEQTTTTRERPQAPAVRRPGVMEMRACFPGARACHLSDAAVSDDLKITARTTQSWL
jgi:hypothetical protein